MRAIGGPAERRRTSAAAQAGGAALALGALGVVFGDIGTSPLYALETVFTADDRAVQVNPSEVYGVVSLVFWTITMIVSVKYVGFIMRADNRGEGGILALTALLQGAGLASVRGRVVLTVLGILGASLFFGDGMITPAVSVLSAVEGLEVAAPSLESLVLPITLVVLTALFAIQRYGTGLVGTLFGPVMAVWFTVIAVIGLAEIAEHPDALKGLSPSYGVEFFLEHGDVAFIALASVVLAVTGAEALYADIGHFGRAPIRRAWFVLVFPALTLNYLAQGSLILRSPSAVENPFFLLVPDWAQIPMVVLATAATVIASQAVISGAFSLARQAVQLGFMPRLTIRHTSAHAEGQIYLPGINWGLFAAVIALVLGFGSSAALASAYGVAVTGTFMLTTILFLAVARLLWHKPKRLIALGAVVFLTVETAFFSATLTKVVHGGWLPLLIGIALFAVLTTWRRGWQMLTRNRARKEGRLDEFVSQLGTLQPPVQRVPGSALFLDAEPETTPLALRANVEHNHVLHENVMVMSIETARTPHVAEGDRLAASVVGPAQEGVTRLTARFGYHDHPDVPAALRLAVARGLLDRRVDLDDTSYFLSQVTIVRTNAPGLRAWRKRLFIAMAHNAASPVDFFRLRDDRTVLMGEQVEL